MSVTTNAPEAAEKQSSEEGNSLMWWGFVNTQQSKDLQSIPQEILSTLRPGDFVKVLGLRSDDQQEQIWLRIKTIGEEGIRGYVVSELHLHWPFQQYSTVQFQPWHIVAVRKLDDNERSEYQLEALAMHHKLPARMGGLLYSMAGARADSEKAGRPLPRFVLDLERSIIEEMAQETDRPLIQVLVNVEEALKDFREILNGTH